MLGARALFVPLLLLGLAGASGEAAAESFHERIEAKPINKGGEVVGLRLKLTLRPNGGEKTVLIGLGSNPNKDNSNYGNRASDPKLGYLVHQFAPIQLDSRNPKEVTLEVLYKDAPGLVPGAEVDVVSAWKGTSRTHVWGMNRGSISQPKITLPAAKTAGGAAAADSAANRARATRGLAAKNRTAASKATARKTTGKATAKKTTRRAATRARR